MREQHWRVVSMRVRRVGGEGRRILPDVRGDAGVGMLEKYFAIKVYGFYALMALLGIDVIFMLVVFIVNSIKRR